MLKTPRAAIVLVFAAFGAMIGAHIGALPVIVRNAAVDQELFGLTQGINMGLALLAMALGGVLSHRFDHRTVMLVAMPAGIVALVGALTVSTPASYVLAFVTFGTLLTFLDLNMNAEGAVIEEEVGKPIFTMFHAAVSLGMAAMSIVSSLLSASHGPGSAAVIPAIIALWALWEVWRLVPARVPHTAHEGNKKMPLQRGKLLLVGLTIGVSNVCEISAILWAGQLLAELKPELIAYSGLGAAFFAGCAGTMRSIGDRLRTRLGEIPVMTAALTTATAGLAILSLSPGFAVSVLAFAAVGAGLAPMFPGLFAMAGRLAPTRRAAAMSFAAVISGGPRVVMPIILGQLAAWYGLSAVFFCATGLALASLALLLFALKPMEKGASLR